MRRAPQVLMILALAGPAAVPAQHADHGARDPGHDGERDAPDRPTDAAPASPHPAALAHEAAHGPEHAAERIHDPALMAARRESMGRAHGGVVAGKLQVDRLEFRAGEDHDGHAWDVEGWYGGDYHKLWLKTKGAGEAGGPVDHAEIQALYSRAASPYFDLQTGLRYDLEPDPSRVHFVLGIHGLAPYWIELDAAGFVSEDGDFSARLTGEYDLRITQRLILQPHVELELAAQEVRALGLGSGLTAIAAGLRLRYAIVPELAPYLGIGYARKLGETADHARANGEDVGGGAVLVGVRAWF